MQITHALRLASITLCLAPSFTTAALGQALLPVVSIADGDTIRVKSETGDPQTIRIACIDASELKQYPHGEHSRKRLQQIIPVGTQASLSPQTKDRYGRIVAEVFKGTLNVGLAMVQEGRAVVYQKYLAQCPSASRYLESEDTARKRRLAFWSQPNPIMPWDARRGVGRSQKLSPPLVQPSNSSAKCDPSYPNVCIPPYPPDLDCGEISFRRFQVIGSDPHRFDGDKDGVGCER